MDSAVDTYEHAKKIADALIARKTPWARLTPDDVLPYVGSPFGDVLQKYLPPTPVVLSGQFDDAEIAAQPLPQSYEEYLRVTRAQEARDRGRFMGTGEEAPLPPDAFGADPEGWHEGVVTYKSHPPVPPPVGTCVVAHYEIKFDPPVLDEWGRVVGKLWTRLEGHIDDVPYCFEGQKVLANLRTGSIRLCP